MLNQRRIVTNPEHRFFLALLLNIDGKDNILSLVRQRYPETDPVEKVLDWVFELSETRVAGTNSSNALGIDGFDAFDMFIFENMLRGKTDGEMSESISTDYPAEQAEELSKKLPDKAARIREAVVFRPLFTDTPA